LNCKPSQMKNPTGGKLKPKQKWQMPAPWPEPACGPNKKKAKKRNGDGVSRTINKNLPAIDFWSKSRKQQAKVKQKP